MAGFTASPPVPTPDAIVDGDGWWPGLSIAAFRAAQRLQRDCAEQRAREALQGAAIRVAGDLAIWRTAQACAGATSLDTIGDAAFGGESRLVILWRRAVYCLAAADLADTHNDISATEAGRARTGERATSADELRRNATQAIRAIKGRTGQRARLI